MVRFFKSFFFSLGKKAVWNEKHTLFKFKSATIIILQLQKPNTMNAYSCTEIGISRSEQFFSIYVQEKKYHGLSIAVEMAYRSVCKLKYSLCRADWCHRELILKFNMSRQRLNGTFLSWTVYFANSVCSDLFEFYRATASIPCYCWWISNFFSLLSLLVEIKKNWFTSGAFWSFSSWTKWSDTVKTSNEKGKTVSRSSITLLESQL